MELLYCPKCGEYTSSLGKDFTQESCSHCGYYEWNNASDRESWTPISEENYIQTSVVPDDLLEEAIDALESEDHVHTSNGFHPTHCDLITRLKAILQEKE